MSQWLDDLSEDWESQARSSSPDSSQPKTTISHNSGSHGTQGTSRRKSVLSERSHSEDNVRSVSGRRTGVKMVRHGLSRRSMSAESSHSIAQNGTTARPSPTKQGRQSDTPEWKRRLLKGEMSYGQQKDLFAPTGIENIFHRPQHPSPQQSQHQPARGLSFLKGLESIPSSPPPWPNTSDSSTHLASRAGAKVEKNLEALDEEEEDGLQEPEQYFGNALKQVDSYDAQSDENESYLNNDEYSFGTFGSAAQPRKTSRALRLEISSVASTKTSQGQSFHTNSSEFSPVYISKHNTADGRVDYAALDLSKSALAHRLRQVAEDRSSHRSDKPKLDQDISGELSVTALEAEILPDDLPVGTPDMADIGEFVSIKRGGYSQDSSFIRRPLSPSPLARAVSVASTDASTIHHTFEEPLKPEQGLVLPPSAPTPPSFPTRTNKTSDVQGALSQERKKSVSTSPLKLFGNHDTFTTNKLHRRISQLEDSIHQPNDQEVSECITAPPSRRTSGSQATVIQEQIAGNASKSIEHGTSSIEDYFGHGGLDGHHFPEDEFSSGSGERSEVHGSIPSRSSSPGALPPGSQQPFRFQVLSPEPEFADTFRGKRKISKVSGKSTLSVTKRSIRTTRPALPLLQSAAEPSTVRPSVSIVSEGKRPPTSPFKNPTPKRRRTLVQIEIQEASAASTLHSHSRFQSAIGKRKDARYSSQSNVADPDVLARRNILRPRNPTPSQRRRDEIEDEIYEAAADFVSSSPRLEAIREHLRVPVGLDESRISLQARAVATEVAKFSEKVAHGMKDDGRKRSVTTQDFLDEAMKIMSFIRNKGRPNSGLNSVVEFDSEVLTQENEAIEEGKESPLTLSRPPSREGKKSVWRSRHPEGFDSDILNHLQKFQEREEDEFVGSSVRSSRFAHEAGRVGSHVHTLESHPPGLQIIERAPSYHSRSNSNATGDGHGSSGTNATANPPHSSLTSMDSSLGRTTASRKSDNVATLAPDAVAHLIPEEVAGMTFDKDRGIWVKNKSPKKQQKFHDEPPSSLTQSENDPFDDIPDLTVDEAQETRHLILRKSTGDSQDMGSHEVKSGPLSGDEHVYADRSNSQDGRSRFSPLLPEKTNSAYVPATTVRDPSATSSGTNSTIRSRSQKNKASSVAQFASTKGENFSPRPLEHDDVEHEIKIHEGRAIPPENRRIHALKKLTLSVSPLATNEQGKHDSRRPQTDAVSKKDLLPQAIPATPARPNSQASRQLSLAVSVAGTLAAANVEKRGLEQTGSSPYRADVTFYMSELPDFTINQIDERELPNRTIVKRTTTSRVQTIEDRFASGNESLVKALQDVEPKEPYWEDLRQVDLHGKSLTSLHLLDILCERLEKVHLENNELSQLGGSPSSIRHMSLQDNQLTALTSWGHLTNLQYLNVSSNDIESLEGFSSLIHLRELRADDNKITHLGGIEFLDGVLALSLRNNRLQELDFEGTELIRLSNLDLGGNGMTKIRGLYCLPALADLNLDDNNFELFPTDDRSCPAMISLSLQRNRLRSLSLSTCAPNLQRLHLDGNQLPTTAGICPLKHLRVLTLRSQTPSSGPCNLDPLVTSSMRDLHTLCLSQNHIPTLSIPHDFLSIRHLELASCGLDSLPSDFGLSVPNLRTLNINFNAVKDLRPLLNIRRLSTLLCAGNRLSRLRKTTAVLSKLAALEVLDLRDNPFSIGFYPKPVERRIVLQDPRLHDSKKDEQNDGRVVSHDDEPMLFTLPPMCKDDDAAYLDRLDEGTRLRRRVFGLLLANQCRRLEWLDGLAFVRGDVLVKDKVWDRLLALGVVKRSGKTSVAIESGGDDGIQDDEVVSS